MSLFFKSPTFVGMLCVAWASTAAMPSQSIAKTLPAPIQCSLKPTDMPSAAKILNAVEGCVKRACTITALEPKEVAGFDNSDWLYNGTNKTFTVIELDGFRATAKSRALATVPPGKTLIKFSYEATVAVANSGSYWFLLATAHYGICSTSGATQTK